MPDPTAQSIPPDAAAELGVVDAAQAAALVDELAAALGPVTELVHLPVNHGPDGPVPYVGEAGDPEAYRRSAVIDREEADTLDPGDERDACVARAEAWDELAVATERAASFPDVVVDETVPAGEAHLRNDAGETVAVITGLDEPADLPARPAAEEPPPPAAAQTHPLPVLLDALAEAQAQAGAVKLLVDELRPQVTAAAMARYADEGTDRYRRDGALITLTFDADRTVVDDEERLIDVLVDAGVDTAPLYPATVELDPAAPVGDLVEAIKTVRGFADLRDAAELDEAAAVHTAAALDILLAALVVKRELDADRALRAVEEGLGAEVTKAGVVVADTGEPVDAIHVERGKPSGIQVRVDAELKASRLADLRGEVFA